MNKFNRLKVVKSGAKYHHRFVTSCDKDITILENLKEKGYLVTVIKSIEYSVSQYLLRTNQSLTIHDITVDGNDVNVTVFKNDDYHVMTIPKALLATGKYNYEFSIGCSEPPKLVDKDSELRLFKHHEKKNVLYVSL